jgi:hypothetical protein
VTARRFTPGAPLASIGAKFLNDVAALVDGSKVGKPGINIATPGDGPWGSSVIIKVRNKSGAAVVRGGVLRLDSPVVTPTQNEAEWRRQIVMDGKMPRGGDALFCITLEPLAVDAIGSAVIAGAIQTKLSIPEDSPTSFRFATPIADRTDALQLSEFDGVPVLYKSDQTDEEAFASVVLDPGRTLEGVVAPQPYRNATYFGGCEFTNCLPESSAWLKDVSCGGCTKLPRFLQLNFPGMTNRGDCGLYKKVAIPSPFSAIEGYFEDWLLEMQTSDGYETGDGSCTYLSPIIPCNNRIRGNCGSVTYTWNAGYRTVDCAVTWRWLPNPCASDLDICKHEWLWVYMGPGAGMGGGDYGWQYQGQHGDCVGGVTSPSPPAGTPFELGTGSTVFTNCTPVVSHAWVADPRPSECGGAPAGLCGDGGGGTLEPPASAPGSGDPTVVIRPCTITVEDEEASGWVQTGSCGCGTAAPPDRDGEFHGEVVVVNCEQPGDPEAAVAAEYRWRLVVNGNDSTLTLEENGIVVWTWKLMPPRGWCCLCANTMVSVSCGPFRNGFFPPGIACLIPVRVNFCPVADLGDEVEVDIGGFITTEEDGPLGEINGVWGMSPAAPGGFEPDGITPVYFPNEEDPLRRIWRTSMFATPYLTCPSTPLCEFHSPIVVRTVDDVEWAVGVSLCADMGEGGFSLALYIHIATVTSLEASGIAGYYAYAASGLDLSAAEWTLTGSGLPAGAPATLTVKRVQL